MRCDARSPKSIPPSRPRWNSSTTRPRNGSSGFSARCAMKAELENETFENESFRGEDLSGLRTTGCTFHGCDFTNARLNGSEHVGSDFANSTFENVNLFGASFEERSEERRVGKECGAR